MRSATRTWMAAMVVAVAVGAAGCGGGTKLGGPTQLQDRDVIALEEIARVDRQTTALQLIQRQRPRWLQGRGPLGFRSEGPLPVYVNNQRVAGASALERYTAGELQELRFLNAAAATQRFGTGHPSGAILLTLR